MSDHAIQEIKARLNIAEVVRRYVDLRQAAGRWMGPCPFHQETKPSFSVNEAEGFYYCFGCQASGDVIDFYMRINGLEFPEALETLAAEAGVELTRHQEDPRAGQERQKKKVILDMHAAAQDHFQRNLALAAGGPARAYLERRGVSPDMIKDFNLGFSLDDWHGLDTFLQSKGWQPRQGVEAGLLSSNEKGSIYDRFRGRLIFPIQDLAGRTIAFGGRIIGEGDPKYLNSSDTPIYKKGEHLYGLHQARPGMNRSRRALLTEGYLDVISLHQFGYQESCGVLGTALTTEQVRRLSGFVNRVDLVFDGDEAGRKAAFKSVEMILAQGLGVGVVLLPEGEDVDSLLQEQGREGFDACLDQAVDGLTFCMNRLLSVGSPREVMNWAVGFLTGLQDGQLAAFFLPRLASGLGLSEVELRQCLRNPGRRQSQAVAVPEQAAPVAEFDRSDEYFLRFPVQYPEYVPALAQRGFGSVLGSGWARGFWNKIREHHGGDVMAALDEEEKHFFVSCRAELLEGLRLSGEDLLEEWRQLCSNVAAVMEKNERKRLMDGLRQAQAGGDREAEMAYSKALSDMMRRDDE